MRSYTVECYDNNKLLSTKEYTEQWLLMTMRISPFHYKVISSVGITAKPKKAVSIFDEV